MESGKVEEQPLKPEDLAQCEAAFLTNVLIGAVPVAEVHGIGNKNPNHPLIQGAQVEIAAAIREDLTAFS